MAGGGGNTTTTKADPWSEAQPYLKDVMGQASAYYHGLPVPSYFPGQTYVNPTGDTNTGVAGLRNSAANSQGLVNTAGNTLQGLATTGSADPGFLGTVRSLSNAGAASPFLDQIQSTAAGNYLHGSPELDSLYNSSASRIQDQVGSRFTAAGRYGSGKYVDQLGRSLGDLNSQIYGQNYLQERQNQLAAANQGQGLLEQANARQLAAATTGQGMLNDSTQRQLQAATLLPSIAQAGSIGPEQSLQAGQIAEQYAGLPIQEAMARWDYAQQAPWSNLQNYNSIIQGFGGLGGTQTQTQPKPSALSQIAGGASAGLGVLSLLGVF